MFKIDSPGNVANLFDEGDPGLGQQPTIVSADWLNAVQTELVNVVLAAGIALDKTNSAQVLAAVRQLFRPKTAWKRQFCYFNETTIAGFNGHTVYNIGELPSIGGEIFEGTSNQIDQSVLYSMVIHVSAACTIPIKFLFNDDAGLFFVDGVEVGGDSSASTSLTSDTFDLTVGDHVIQVLNNNTGGNETQLVLAEWLTGLPITWLRAAVA